MDYERHIRATHVNGMTRIRTVVTNKMTVLGKNIPLTTRNGVSVEEFYILPFPEKKKGIIIASFLYSGGVCFPLVVTMKDGLPHVHYMNNDSEKWQVTFAKLTQSVGEHLELLLGSDRFTIAPLPETKDMFSVDGDVMAKFLADEISGEEFRASVSAEPEIVKLQRLIDKSNSLHDEMVATMQEQIDELETDKKDLTAFASEMAEKTAKLLLSNDALKIKIRGAENWCKELERFTDLFLSDSQGIYRGKREILKIGRKQIKDAVEMIRFFMKN